MIVVADTGPLHYLILLGHADLLHRFYGEVVVPDAVATELTTPSAPKAVRDWMSHPPEWLSIVPVDADRVQDVTDERPHFSYSIAASAGLSNTLSGKSIGTWERS